MDAVQCRSLKFPTKETDLPIKITPFGVAERLSGLSHQHYIGLVRDFRDIGWESPLIVQPAQADGTPGQLIIAVSPDYSVFETASEQH